MFCLRISLTSATIDTVKERLLKSLPHVKSSHRVEAAARGLGFQTNAAMRVALQQHNNIIAEVRWAPFVTYLKGHGFETDGSPIGLGFATQTARAMLKINPHNGG